MRIIKAHTEFPLGLPGRLSLLKSIESVGRTCYKSPGKTCYVEPIRVKNEGDEHWTEKYALFINSVQDSVYDSFEDACARKSQIEWETAEQFIRTLIMNGHEAMLEHVSITVKFVVDRGVSHELVRHRLASFAQESTRYCNYSAEKFGREITVIEPCFWTHEDNEAEYEAWIAAMYAAENSYLKLLEMGALPQEARSVLPNSLKTEVVMTANLREWRHFLKLRAAGVTGKPHPQMLEVAVPLLEKFKKLYPAVFFDINVKEEKEDGDETDK